MKKIIASIICLCIIFTASFGALAYTTDESIKLLNAMGVLQGDPNGNMRPDDAVKRSEFAKLAVLLSEHSSKVSLNSKISVFTDCPASHWAAPYVKVASENGYIQGYSNGIFAPDDYITYTQAVTIALRLLGYTDEDFGFSYPAGQLGMALSLKLNSGMSKSADDTLTRADVAVILTNMLMASKKGSSGTYISSLGYSLKEDTIIIATNSESAAVATGKVYTSTGEYNIDGEFNTSLIGKKGTALVNSENKLLTLLVSDIKTNKYAVYSAGNELLSIYANGGIDTLNCDNGTLCYNGTEKTNFSSLRSKLSTGDILTVATDKSGNIDYIIAGESDFDGPYTVKSDSVIPKEEDYSSYSVIKNGSKANFKDIKQNDIVYISSALSTVFCYSKKVSGIYSKAIPNVDSPKSVVVGGKEYALESTSAFSAFASNGSFSIGDTVVLLIGRDGGIADVLGQNNTQSQISQEDMVHHENVISAPDALLLALGSIDSVDVSISPVTRGQFAKMAVMISAFRNSVALGSKLSIFPDCTASYWATPYIKTCVENALMSAYNDSYFRPESAITYAEAADTCLKILGYSSADFTDWPSSQLSLANSKGISKNLNKTQNDTLTKSEVVTLLYNTLKATSKNGVSKGISNIGYEYYEDVVLIATSKENSSVSAGKVLTSVGTFTVDENNFNYSDIGSQGQLLVFSGKVQMFNKNSSKYAEATVYSVVPTGVAVSSKSGTATIDIPADTPVYANASKTTFNNAKENITTGDYVKVCYDNNNRVQYVYVNTSALAGPYSVINPSDWYTVVSGANRDSTIMKNGSKVTSDALNINDILYFSSTLNTAFVYSDKVIGILESATPSKNAPTSVKVSGTTYTIESADVSFADSEYGETVVLCLGKTGKVAKGYSASGTEVAGYLISTGMKTFTNNSGETYTSYYATLALADGTKIDFATETEYDGWLNGIMSAKFSSGKAKLNVLTSPGTLSGRVDAETMKVGTVKLSSNVKIIDVAYIEKDQPSTFKSVYPQRLDGLYLDSTNVLYVKKDNGLVTELILANVTGDAVSYGVITSAKSNISGMSASGSYTCDIGGSSYSYSGGVYTNLKKGSVVSAVVSGGRIVSFSKLNSQSVNIKSIDYTSVTTKDGKKLTISDDVFVYKLTGSFDYTYIPFSEFVDKVSQYSNISVYTDKSESLGGRVRIIVVK